MKKISVLFFLISFLFGYSQVEEFKTADDIYNKKMKTLLKKFPKETIERFKQEKVLLDEKILSYKKTLEKINIEEQKGITEYPAPSVPPVTKRPEFELGESQFKALLFSAYADNISSLNYNISSPTYTARLTCAVDSKGYVYDVRVKGKNANINTFILAAFYRIKDKGKWKPAEINGQPILYGFSYPITLKFQEAESDFTE
ncbi:hypothetical protein [Chryseobacterium scophthalmum]|uniref:hypothetical protein n=1 Tax=Chryseobacterium scophthalmum TaxID=59733 RepID=UPI003D063486